MVRYQKGNLSAYTQELHRIKLRYFLLECSLCLFERATKKRSDKFVTGDTLVRNKRCFVHGFTSCL